MIDQRKIYMAFLVSHNILSYPLPFLFQLTLFFKVHLFSNKYMH